MEKNKAWVLMYENDPVAVCYNRADVEELFMDLVLEEQFIAFCWNWLLCGDSLELALKYSNNNHCYYFTDVVGWR